MGIVKRTPGEQEAWRAGFEAGSHLAAGGTGAILNAEEAALAREAIRYWVMIRAAQGVPELDRFRVLADRLESAS